MSKALWYPCTQMQHTEQFPPLKVVKAKGAYLYTSNNLKLLDAISSWWVNLHGHNHPVISQAITQQMQEFEHVMLAGLTHEPIEQLAEQLVALLPTTLSKVFFADSGSAAIEIALKMSLQYWHQTGEPTRNTFISLQQGYHGETLGSLSVTDIPLFNSQYQPLLIKHIKAPSPDISLKPPTQSEDDYINLRLKEIEGLLQHHYNHICGIIIEPLVQGAAGMKMYPASYLVGLKTLCGKYNVHLIFDEIAVGFGRTGKLFALEHALQKDEPATPDFLCLSKGLTGGYLPMSCVVTTKTTYQAFYSPNIELGFLHSHSYTGNALAAAAGLASLNLLQTTHHYTHRQQLADTMQQVLSTLKHHPNIYNIRQTGLIGAFTVNTKGTVLAKEIALNAQRRGVWLRPIGNHVYFMPPYCISAPEIQHMVTQAVKACESALLGLEKRSTTKAADSTFIGA